MYIKTTPTQLEAAYFQACLAELQALKPGNVHIFADGHGMTIDDFMLSAEVSAKVIAMPSLTVGERIFGAVEATQNAVGQNTNLGIILLCAPLIHAALQANTDQTFQQSLQEVLNKLSIEDAKLVAQAIMLAKPAGLGTASKHDVQSPPKVNLLEMMQSAQEKDRIAWQYANNFADVIEFGVRYYHRAYAKYQNQAWATTALYLGFLARQADTHIIRKHSTAAASQLMQDAQAKERLYWATDNPKLVQQQLLVWDATLKNQQFNPGTSADLTVATLLLEMLCN